MSLTLINIVCQYPNSFDEYQVSIIPSGIDLNKTNVDRALKELFVKQLRGQYLPLEVVVTGHDSLMVKADKCKFIVDRDFYIGGVEFRSIDRWAYGSSLLEHAEVIDVEFEDGTSFYVHRNKGLAGNHLNNETHARISRAVMSVRPEWGKQFKTISLSKYKYLVKSTKHSNLDVASHDIKHVRPRVCSVLGSNNAERFFLERSNIRLDLEMDPYPMGPYIEELDGVILDNMDDVSKQDKNEVRIALNSHQIPVKKVQNKIVINSGFIKYGNIKIPRTEAVNRLLSHRNVLPCEVLAMYGRYLSINQDGDAQYTHTPKIMADYLHEYWDVRYEGYSAPFNAMHQTFSSMYYNLDSMFGSVGPFSWENIVRFQDHNMSINPPFTHYFYKFTRESIEKAFKQVDRKELLIFCKQPNWYEEENIEWFKDEINNPYLVGFAEIPIGEFFFERINGEILFKLTGGLLFSVLSPLGKSHPTFDDKSLNLIKDFYAKSVPLKVKTANLKEVPYFDKYRLKTMLKQGISVQEIQDMLKNGKASTKMTLDEIDTIASLLMMN